MSYLHSSENYYLNYQENYLRQNFGTPNVQFILKVSLFNIKCYY